MRRTWTLITTAGLAAAGFVAVTPSPSSATVTATSSGTILTVTATGDGPVQFDCTGGNVRISGAFASPTIACGTVNHVNVIADAGAQTVQGDDLDAAVFTAHPYLVALTGGGADVIYGTDRADSLTAGAGNDAVWITSGGVSDTTIDLGADADELRVTGGAGTDTLTAAASGTTATLSLNDGGGAITQTASGVESLTMGGGDGADTLSAAGVNPGSLASTRLVGNAGDDHLIGGPTYVTMVGGSGTNTMTGSTGIETFVTESDTDTIHPDPTHPGSGSTNSVYDETSPHLGRTVANEGTLDQWFGTVGHSRDSVLRYRPLGSYQSLITASLDRPGQQQLGGSFTNLNLGSGFATTLPTHHLFDVVAPQSGTTVYATGDSSDDDPVDVTVTEGSWTTSGTAATTLTITTGSINLGEIVVKDAGAVSIHGPWTGADLNKGFVHRATRDLVFRFPTDTDRDALAAQLTAGTTNRAAVVAGLMGTDEYRGLDVDRVFVKYLQRAADPSGRTYWINRLAEGRALWRFRAQLFGSSEYFTKAGGTNATYVAKAYNDVLGRDPDPSGRTYWTNKLNHGADRGSVALQFINSPEARRRLVDDQFLRFLDRKPTATEQTTWVARIPDDDGEQALIAFLASSTAYLNRS